MLYVFNKGGINFQFQNLEENKPSTIEEEKLCKELNQKMAHRQERLKEKYSNKKNYNYNHNNPNSL